MHANFLHKLFDLASAYEAEGGDTSDFDREDFIAWLLSAQKREADPPPMNGLLPPVNGLIAMYLGMMGKYAEFYARRVMRHSVLYSLDDWSVLITLFPDAEMKKTEVLRRCVLEKSSGNEVLKRLLRQGLIAESPNPVDQRSKLIRLTDAGKAAFASVETSIYKLSDLVVADLSEEEKSSLLAVLFKLNRYHRPVFEAGDEEDLERRLGMKGVD
jgi:DNA-binding MarR family transcriptional regulator